MTDEMATQYEDDWSEHHCDDDDDLFDAVVDREARSILFNALQISYHFVRVYKHQKMEEITDLMAHKFEVYYFLFFIFLIGCNDKIRFCF